MQGVKTIRHPILGEIQLEYSSFGVDGRSDLDMIVYNPVDQAIAERIRAMVRADSALQAA
jgi:hypothetical protein